MREGFEEFLGFFSLLGFIIVTLLKNNLVVLKIYFLLGQKD